MTTSKSTSFQSGCSWLAAIGDDELDCFIVLLVYLVKQYVEVCHASYVGEDTSFGVFGDGAAVDAYAGSVGYVIEDGQELLELGRPCAFDGVCSCGDEEIGVFERGLREGLEFVIPVKHREGHRALDGFTLPVGSDKFNRSHIKSV